MERAKEILKGKKESPTWILADEIEEEFEGDIPELTASVWSNLIADALGRVDWYGIAERLMDEAKDNE